MAAQPDGIPMEPITEAMLLKLADDAELELDKSQIGYLVDELNRQRSALVKLCEAREEMGEDWTDAMSHGMDYPKEIRPPLREDRIEPFDNAAQILEQAPANDRFDESDEGGHFLVPPERTEKR